MVGVEMAQSDDQKTPDDIAIDIAEMTKTTEGTKSQIVLEQITESGATEIDRSLILPPKETGLAAWRALTAAILLQAVLVAFPLTFGVFQDYLRRDVNVFDSSQTIWIGVLSTGVPFLGAPFMTCVCKTFPRVNRRYYVFLGWAICVLSLVGASFSTSVLPIAMTQGLLYGIGIFILDAPVLLILNTWFEKRRGLAYGILFSITDLFGFIFAFLAETLLHRCGFRWTLLTFAAIIVAISGPAMLIFKRRPPQITEVFCVESPLAIIRRCAENARRYSRHYKFYLFTLSNLLQAFAFYLPFIYLPSYTTDLGYSATQGSLVLALANFAQVFGELGFGKLSDKVNVYSLIVASSLVASIAVLALWGLAQSLVQLIFFALIFGISASGFISLWAGMGQAFGEENAQMIYSILSFCRGLANIASGPVSTALLHRFPEQGPSHHHHHRTYGNRKYTGVILLVGICLACSAFLGGIGVIAGWLKKEEKEAAGEVKEAPTSGCGVEV